MMRVYELIDILKAMPQEADIKVRTVERVAYSDVTWDDEMCIYPIIPEAVFDTGGNSIIIAVDLCKESR